MSFSINFDNYHTINQIIMNVFRFSVGYLWNENEIDFQLKRALLKKIIEKGY